MLITQKTKINIILSSSFLLCMSMATLMVSNHIQKMGHDLEKQMTMVATYADRAQKHAELLRFVEASDVKREELMGYILTRAEVPNFVTQGEHVAASQGVIYTTDSLEQIATDGDFDQLLVAFTMEGAENDVLHMLKVFETMPFHGQITSVQLDRVSSEKEGNVLARVKLAVTLADI